MGTYLGPNITRDSLVVHLDVDNPECYLAQVEDVGIPSGTYLYNLVKGSEISYFYNDQATEAYQDIVSNNGHLVLRHNAYVASISRDTTWRSNVTIIRVNEYTLISWFKFDNTGQQVENIYGGGFDSRTAFYMSPGGTSENHGVLLYSDVGSTNSKSNTGLYGANDGNWHMRAFTVTGPDVGVQTFKFYVDNELKFTDVTNSSHDNPDGAAVMRWGSWSGTFGNLDGDLNFFMYYERVLSDDEIIQIYNATKKRFQ